MSAQTLEEALETMNAIAKRAGNALGVVIGVGEDPDSDDQLVFVDSNGDPIHDDDKLLVALTKAEMDDPNFELLSELSTRVQKAAFAARWYGL
jgi:hypothetical protein